jgi:hypothetical protein
VGIIYVARSHRSNRVPQRSCGRLCLDVIPDNKVLMIIPSARIHSRVRPAMRHICSISYAIAGKGMCVHAQARGLRSFYIKHSNAACAVGLSTPVHVTMTGKFV